MSWDIDDDAPQKAAPRPQPPRTEPPYEERLPEEPPFLPRGARQPEGRVLPHSLEAEEYLLSCCLLDGADVLDRCEEAKVTPASFYDPKHGIVFGCMMELLVAKKPIDISVVAEELKATRQLDMVGGYAFLTQVSSRIPTTAQAGYFIQKVRELALLRAIIRSSTGLVEDCYGFSGGIEQFVQEKRTDLDRVMDGVVCASDLAAACKFNENAPIEEAKVAYRLNGIVVCTAGNLTNIVSRAGVGKSAMLGAMFAAVMKHPKDTLVDSLGWSGENPHGLPLLHFDTEQNKSDWQKVLLRSRRRANLERLPTWFHSYLLTGKTPTENREIVRAEVRRLSKKHGGIFAIVIDGWGDLCMDPNDTQEAFPFVTEMHAMAIRHDCPIIGVLHLNPGAESKSRGHLGSQLDRKCEAVIQLDMDEDLVTAVWATKKRGAPILKENGPRFSWDNDKEMHTSIGDWKERKAEARAAKQADKKSKNPAAFEERYSREEQVSFYPASTAPAEGIGVIQRRAQTTTGINPRTVARLRLQFLKDGWIVSSGDCWRRTSEGDMWAGRKPAPPAPESLPGFTPPPKPPKNRF